MSKKTDPIEAHARSLALKVRKAEDGVVESMNAFLTAQNKRMRSRALARIARHEEVKRGLLELASRLPDGEMMDFLGYYTGVRAAETGQKFGRFAGDFMNGLKESGVVPEYKTAICQHWLESEAGWGQRPDGFSLHWTTDDLRTYVKAYEDGLPNEVPAEYSRTCGEPFAVKIPMGSEWDKELTKATSKRGIRCYDRGKEPERL